MENLPSLGYKSKRFMNIVGRVDANASDVSSDKAFDSFTGLRWRLSIVVEAKRNHSNRRDSLFDVGLGANNF